MTIREKTFWLDTVEMPAIAQRSLPECVDVAVIGGGFTGLSAARTLAKRGANVAVLEAYAVGWGASSRNGGMVLTGLKLSASTLISRYGKEAARRMYDGSLKSIDCVEQIVREENIDCNFARCGHLEVACKAKHFDDFQRGAEIVAREFAHTLRIVPKNELQSEIGSPIYHGGLVDEASAGVNPARYVAGLARAAERAGAHICEGARVERIDPGACRGGQNWKITTSRGVLRSRELFVASSGYTSNVTPALQKKIVPIGSYIIVTEPLAENLAREASPRDRMIFDSKNYLYYYRLTPDRRMLFGGRAAFFPETEKSIRTSAEILRRGMVSVYPQLQDVRVDYVWGGTLDFAFDSMPHAGRLDGMYFSLGYAGHGVAMSTYLGAKMADLIFQGGGDNPFSDAPFPGAPLGLYDGRPWFLPFAGAWYKFLDWVS
jgi:glycine/D-amino acid oxidase-like deaminating enzyme